MGRGEIPPSRFNGPEPGQCEDVLRIFWQVDQLSCFAVFLQNPFSEMHVFAMKLKLKRHETFSTGLNNNSKHHVFCKFDILSPTIQHLFVGILEVGKIYI